MPKLYTTEITLRLAVETDNRPEAVREILALLGELNAVLPVGIRRETTTGEATAAIKRV